MILIPDPEHRLHRPVHAAQDAGDPLLRGRPGHRRELHAATRATSPRRPRRYLKSTGIADTAYFGPEPEFFIFDDVRFEYDAEQGVVLQVDSVEGMWNTGTRGAGPQPRLQAPHQAGLLPRAADGPLPGPALGDGGDAARASASRSSCTTTRWPPAARARSASGSTRCWPMGDQLMTFKYVLKNVAWHGAARRSRSCRSRSSRTTARACTPTSRCGRAASRCSSTRPATPGCPTLARWYIGGLLHHARAILAFASADHEQLQAAGARLRGAGEPRVLASATGRRRAASRSRQQSPKAKRVEFRCPDSSSNPYLAFSAMMHGRPRRRAEPDRAAGPGRQGPLRPAARGAGQGAAGARLARRVARAPSRTTTTS